MTADIIDGDAKIILHLLEPESIHCCVTSPPYYGLRNYGTDGEIWGGDDKCEHEWNSNPTVRKGSTNGRELSTLVSVGSDKTIGPGLENDVGETKQFRKDISDTCFKCGAWRGELGLEPTPEMYVQHLVEICKGIKRVLRKDGVFWLNIGDSYASGKGSCFNPGGNENSIQDNIKQSGGIPTLRPNISDVKSWGCKPKDLIGIPWLVAFALRADGWYLRADLPWIKRNAMPSSVRDRPASSIEHVFLLSKSQKYYYDHIATMQPASTNEHRPNGVVRTRAYGYEGKLNVHPEAPLQFKKQDTVGNNTYTGFNSRYEPNGIGLRFMRDSDFFFKTWQGLLHNEDGEPIALVVNPRPYKGAHFACFPVQLVEPMILAGTSDRGVCPECGAPWVRDIQKRTIHHENWFGDKQDARHSRGSAGTSYDEPIGYDTTGWHPTCSCNQPPFPATILDPFSGSASTGVACQWHNRNFIGIEIKPDYCKLGEKRLQENK